MRPPLRKPPSIIAWSLVFASPQLHNPRSPAAIDGFDHVIDGQQCHGNSFLTLSISHRVRGQPAAPLALISRRAAPHQTGVYL